MIERSSVQVLSVRDAEDADKFLRELVFALSAQKRASRSFGSTTIELKWRGGELQTAEIRDCVTVKVLDKS